MWDKFYMSCPSSSSSSFCDMVKEDESTFLGVCRLVNAIFLSLVTSVTTQSRPVYVSRKRKKSRKKEEEEEEIEWQVEKDGVALLQSELH